MPRHPRHSKGFTLIEILMVMGVGMIITVGVWQVFAERRTILDGTRLAQTTQTVMELAEEVYANSVEFQVGDGLTYAQPIRMDRLDAALEEDLPQGVIYVPGAPIAEAYMNQWGGFWTTAAQSSNGGADLDIMALQTTRVPPEECKVAVVALGPVMYDLRVNGTLVHLQRDPGSSTRNTVDFGQATALCSRPQNTLLMRRLKELNLSDLRRIWPLPDTLTAEEQGASPSWRYRESYLEHYQRIEDALAAREAAQAALD